MNMKSSEKLNYDPPSVEVNRVVVEAVIAASPIQKVNLKDWEYETADEPGNNADVVLHF